MRVRQLLNETMGAQQSKFTANGGRTPASFGRGCGWRRVEQALQITIAEAMHCEFAVVGCL
jgi:hypothetical protein